MTPRTSIPSAVSARAVYGAPPLPPKPPPSDAHPLRAVPPHRSLPRPLRRPPSRPVGKRRSIIATVPDHDNGPTTTPSISPLSLVCVVGSYYAMQRLGLCSSPGGRRVRRHALSLLWISPESPSVPSVIKINSPQDGGRRRRWRRRRRRERRRRSCCWAASEPMQPTPLLLSAEEGGLDVRCKCPPRALALDAQGPAKPRWTTRRTHEG